MHEDIQKLELYFIDNIETLKMLLTCAHPEGLARWCTPSSHTSLELLDPSCHAFHRGAPTHRLDYKTMNQCRPGRSFSLRICTRI